MMELWKTQEGTLHRLETPEPGCWVRLTDPDEKELAWVKETFGIPGKDLEGPMDLQETPGARVTDESAQILLDVPALSQGVDGGFQAIPLGLVVKKDVVVTVSSRKNTVLDALTAGKGPVPDTASPVEFVNGVLAAVARSYQDDLRKLDARRQEVETRAGEQVAKQDLITLHNVETSLIWFGCSLKANVKALEQLRDQLSSSKFCQEQEILEEAAVEMNQAAAMTDMYREIASATRGLVADLADNRLNNVMKFLTSMTLVLAVPTIVSGFYGMNVNEDSIPLADLTHSFLVVVVLTLVLTVLVIVVLKKKKML
ncbi:magnesium transporter CorA family protein [Faecalibaculum rodentium]|uniref:magnesium transporter CorA family protein n=1 Tax=Faecalibaculum rodentium TaxID=1702221 RepID=UPI00272BD98D|nr:magnesium transporter CorA family protein [Faecalibaculum rodentium]